MTPKSEILDNLIATIVENTTGDVTATDILTVFQQIIDSYLHKEDSINHNDLANLNLDDYKHLTAVQLSALETIISTYANKVNVSDIINDLTTGGVSNPLSSEQGKALKTLIDSVSSSLSGYATTSALANKLPYTLSTTGSNISFDTPKVYNSPSTPSSSNLTNTLSGSMIGVVQKIYSNKSVEPTYPAGWVKVGTGTYTTGALNIIFVEWIEGTRCEYWITKPAS